MQDPILLFKDPKNPSPYCVHKIEGMEAINTLFFFRLGVLPHPNAALLTPEFIGKPCQLRWQESKEAFCIHGVISSITSQAHAMQPLQEWTLVPTLAPLEQITAHHFFENQTTPDIVEFLLTKYKNLGYQFTHRWLLVQDYTKQSFVLQKGESVWRFICSLLCTAKISFYFKHEQDETVLILTDAPEQNSFYQGKLCFYEGTQPQDPQTTIDLFSPCEKLSTQHQPCDEYESEEPEEMRNYVAQKSPIFTAHSTQVVGQTYSNKAKVGALLEILKYPLERFNRIYLLVEIRYEWNKKQHSTLRVKKHIGAVFAQETLKFCHKDSKAGPVSLCGLVSDIDKAGKYRVSFPFNRTQKTRPMAKSQPHSGINQGIHFPLKQGCEVLITLLGQDNKTPVILGILPHAKNPNLVTAQIATQHTIKSGGGHCVLFDDAPLKSRIEINNKFAQITIRDKAEESAEKLQAQHEDTTNLQVKSDYANQHVEGYKEDFVQGKKVQIVSYDFPKAQKIYPQLADDKIAYEQYLKGDEKKTIFWGGGKEVIKEKKNKVIKGKYKKTVLKKNSSQVRGDYYNYTFNGLTRMFTLGDYPQWVKGNKNTFTLGLTTNMYQLAYTPIFCALHAELFSGINIRTNFGLAIHLIFGYKTKSLKELFDEIRNTVNETHTNNLERTIVKTQQATVTIIE